MEYNIFVDQTRKSNILNQLVHLYSYWHSCKFHSPCLHIRTFREQNTSYPRYRPSATKVFSGHQFRNHCLFADKTLSPFESLPNESTAEPPTPSSNTQLVKTLLQLCHRSIFEAFYTLGIYCSSPLASSAKTALTNSFLLTMSRLANIATGGR
jgi:hypothetical protein